MDGMTNSDTTYKGAPPPDTGAPSRRVLSLDGLEFNTQVQKPQKEKKEPGELAVSKDKEKKSRLLLRRSSVKEREESPNGEEIYKVIPSLSGSQLSLPDETAPVYNNPAGESPLPVTELYPVPGEENPKLAELEETLKYAAQANRNTNTIGGIYMVLIIAGLLALLYGIVRFNSRATADTYIIEGRQSLIEAFKDFKAKSHMTPQQYRSSELAPEFQVESSIENARRGISADPQEAESYFILLSSYLLTYLMEKHQAQLFEREVNPTILVKARDEMKDASFNLTKVDPEGIKTSDFFSIYERRSRFNIRENLIMYEEENGIHLDIKYGSNIPSPFHSLSPSPPVKDKKENKNRERIREKNKTPNPVNRQKTPPTPKGEG